MRITYTIEEVAQVLNVECDDDLKTLLEEVDRELRTRHPELRSDPNLLPVLADGLLNSLVDDQEEVDLGKLGGKG